MRDLCCVKKWRIGIDLVMYRDVRDYIGFHSDNNQGECNIVTLIVINDDCTRRVVIKQKKVIGKACLDTEHYEIFLRAGDAYEMDGKFIVHCVVLLL